jgi:predicted ferric reductase
MKKNTSSINLQKKIIISTLIIFTLFSLIIFTKIFLEKTNFESSNSILYNAGALFGAIGFILLSLLIISGETARFFDKYFGIDQIIKTQRIFSIITALFVLTHPILFILSNSTMATYLIPDFTLIPFAMGTIALYLFIIILIASILYKKISNTVWQILHIIIYFLFFISIFHAVNAGSSFQNNSTVRLIFLILMISIITGIIYRTQYKIKLLLKPKHKVEEIKKETEDTFTIKITKPEKFKYESGQFCFLKINKNKLYARHPFTISSAPHQEALEFTIKDTGKFTSFARKMNKGDSIKIEGPYGTFKPEPNKDLILIAGGVGITPFISIIKDMTRKQSKQKIILLYTSKTKKDIIFEKQLQELQQKNKNLKIIYYLSRENKKGYETRMNEQNIKKHIKIKNPEKTILMMCGPEGLKKEIKKILTKKEIKLKIKEESFFW